MNIKWLSSVPNTEYSLPFVQGMADRMMVSYAKYGAVTDAYPDRVDAVASLEKRLAKYKETGNTEWLMDVGNFAMIEFMRPRHPQAHYLPTDSKDSPGRTWVHGGDNQKRNTPEIEKLYSREGD